MTFKNKICFIILGLGAQLVFSGYLATEPLEAGDNDLRQVTVLTASVPRKDRLTLISLFPLALEGKMVGALAMYDDPATKRPVDYLELYNGTGDLLAVNWFDGFGIERTLVDRGLLQEAHKLEGVFVVLLSGDAI